MKPAPFVVECSERRNGPWRDAFGRGVCWQRAKEAYTPARNFWLSAAGSGLFVRIVRIGAQRAAHSFAPSAANSTRQSDAFAARWCKEGL